jgi:photosystem II stability/assembly factor-like uncharacterized protein
MGSIIRDIKMVSFLDKTMWRFNIICFWMCICSLFVWSAGSAQTWVNLDPFNQPPGNLLHSVSFVDETYGWTVGEGGYILHSADGGSTWQEQGEGVTEEDLFCVDFVDRQHGWACGNSGVIVYTEDGGQSWEQQTTNTNENLLGVEFVDTRNGWVVGEGGTILNTTDGGQTWSQQPGGDGSILRSVSFVDSLQGWTVGSMASIGFILHTSDGGLSWTPQGDIEDNLYCVDFTDTECGWIYGGGDVYRTTDGGENWQKVTSERHLFSGGIWALSCEELWGVGYNGLIEHTDNGGQSWELQNHRDMPNSVTEHDLWGVCFVNAQKGWAVGELATILHTSDGGDHWQVQHTRESINMSEGIFVDENKGWFVTYSTNGWQVWHSVDGGMNWHVQYEEEDVFFHTIFFSDSLHGWMAGGGFMWRTTDSGTSWVKTLTPGWFYCLVFFDSLIGFAGTDHAIYKTEDGGESWEAQVVPQDIYFSVSDIFFVDDQYGWTGGSYLFDSGVILNTADGGSTWHVQTYGSTIFAIHFVDREHGVATANNPWYGSIYLTLDGGQTWTSEYTTGAWLHDCYLVDENNGWATGSDGFLFRTTDGGENWNVVDVGVQASLENISFVEDNQIGYIFGEDNTLLRYEQPPPLKGDINSDGNINILDIVRGVNIILELPPQPTEYELWAADMNEDGKVNILDLVDIVNIILSDPTQY